jgi:LuxR family maltose regulon positive regulatory protein
MDVNDTNPWQDTVDLLRLVKNDYEGVRKNLKIVYETLAEREDAANQRLSQALLLRGGYKTLSLVPVGSGAIVSQIGKVILGETIPYKIPGMLRLDVHCFDRLEVYSGSKKLEHWQNANAKSLFKLFIIKLREPIPKEVLIEYLWPEASIGASSNNLKVAIHGLRKILNRFLNQEDNFPSIVFKYGCYELNSEIDLWTDIEQFEHHWSTARRLEKEGNLAAAIKEYRMAEALYKGDYLEDEPYNDQTLIRRETLKDIYLTIMGKLADYSFDIKDYEESIIYCQKIIAKDNCREDAYRRLMRCYSRLGNRSRAIRWYEICCRAIQTELDTTPEHATIELYKLLSKDVYI